MNGNIVLALRNLLRSPKRSLSLLALMCSAFLALTLIKAGYADMFSGIKKSYRVSNGDVAFSIPDSGGMDLSEYEALKKKLIAGGRVTALKAAVPIQGLIGTESGSAPISGYAIEGVYSDWRTGEDSIKVDLGAALADSLSLNAGDEFSGLANGSGFSFRAASIIHTEAKARDRFFLRMPLEALAESDSDSKPSKISLWFADRGIAREKFIEELRAMPEFAGYLCSAYVLGNTQVNSIVRVYEDNFAIVLIVVAATMLLALANVTLLSAWERGQEWGTMLALGNRHASLDAVIAFEALALALAACAIGGILTVAISAIVNAAGGITLPPPPTSSNPIKIGLKPEADAFLLASLVSLLCALAAAFIAARNLRRSTIIQLLYERN
jgi:putative ABC transport system permease protein